MIFLLEIQNVHPKIFRNWKFEPFSSVRSVFSGTFESRSNFCLSFLMWFPWHGFFFKWPLKLNRFFFFNQTLIWCDSLFGPPLEEAYSLREILTTAFLLNLLTLILLLQGFYANSALSIHGHITLILGKFSHEIHPPPFSCLLNSHVDKMGSQGPKHYGFGDHLVWVPEKTKLEQYSQLFVNSVH